MEERLQTFVLEHRLDPNLGIMDDPDNSGEGTNISHAEILEIVTLDQLSIELVVTGIIHGDFYLVVGGFNVAIGIDEDFDYRQSFNLLPDVV